MSDLPETRSKLVFVISGEGRCKAQPTSPIEVPLLAQRQNKLSRVAKDNEAATLDWGMERKSVLSVSSFCAPKNNSKCPQRATLEERRGKNRIKPSYLSIQPPLPTHHSLFENTCSRWIHKYTRWLPLWCQGEPIQEQRGCSLTPHAGQGARILWVGLSQLPKNASQYFS